MTANNSTFETNEAISKRKTKSVVLAANWRTAWHY